MVEIKAREPPIRIVLVVLGSALFLIGLGLIGVAVFQSASSISSCACIASVLDAPLFYLGGIITVVGGLVLGKAGYVRLGKLSWMIGEKDDSTSRP
jgi:hypothetical protein